MEYKDKITSLVNKVPRTLVDFEEEKKRGRPPTQAFSEFLINREQGDRIRSRYVAVLCNL